MLIDDTSNNALPRTLGQQYDFVVMPCYGCSAKGSADWGGQDYGS